MDQLEDLKRQMQEHDEKKQLWGAIGSAAETMANAPTRAQLAIGYQPNHKIDLTSNMVDPIERQKKLLDAYRAQKEGKLQDLQLGEAERKAKINSELDDVGSERNQRWRDNVRQMLRAVSPRLADSIGDNMTEANAPDFLKSMVSGEYGIKEKLAARQNIPKGMTTETMPDGSTRLVPLAGSFKPDQYKAAGFGSRADLAEKDYQKLIGTGYDPAGLQQGLNDFSVKIPLVGTASIPERLKSDSAKKYDTATRNFISAVLRPESGAAIPEHEIEQERKKYFPQAGDSKEVKQQKAQMRAMAIAALRSQAGGAWDEVQKNAARMDLGSEGDFKIIEQKNPATGETRHVRRYADGREEVVE